MRQTIQTTMNKANTKSYTFDVWQFLNKLQYNISENLKLYSFNHQVHKLNHGIYSLSNKVLVLDPLHSLGCHPAADIVSSLLSVSLHTPCTITTPFYGLQELSTSTTCPVSSKTSYLHQGGGGSRLCKVSFISAIKWVMSDVKVRLSSMVQQSQVASRMRCG